MSTHKQNQFVENTLASDNSWAVVFSFNSRKAWIIAYALTFVALLALQFGGMATALLVFGATFLQGAMIERSDCSADRSHTYSGALISAGLLYLSLLATSGFELLASIALSLVLYAFLTVVEAVGAAVMQTLFASKGDARGKIAWLLDKKFGGFFGVIH